MILNTILPILIAIIMRTLRVEIRNDGPVRELLRSRKPFVLVFWHGSMTFPWWYMRRKHASALVSMSKDGQILASLLKAWGYRVIRGSSSRGSREAMSLMRQTITEGYVLCVTPDGPRGPYHEMKMGAVRVAQTTGVPLVMMSVGYSHYRRLRSWDRFEVPFPFTRAYVEVSDPIHIDPELDGEALDEKRAELEKQMHAQYRTATLTLN